MAKPKCPSCKRESTYSAKYDQCSGCGRGYNAQPANLTVLASPMGLSLPPNIGEGAILRMLDGGKAFEILNVEPGEPCPACGKPVGKKPAQLQREYRERKKEANQ